VSERTRRLLRVAASVVLLAITAALVDVRGVVTTLRELEVGPLLVAGVLTVPVLAVAAWRWQFTAVRMGIRLRFGLALREYYASTLLNQVLPGGVLGDVSRVLRLHGQPKGLVTRCVVIERASGQVALWLTIAVAAMWWGLHGSGAVAMALVTAVGLVLALAVVVLRIPVVAASRPGRMLGRAVGDLRATMVTRGAWAVQLATSFVGVALLSAMFWLCIVAVGAEVSPPQALLIAPLVLAASALPISVGGWGVREAAGAGLFGLLGLSPALGAAASAAFGAVNLVGSLPGAIFLLRRSK
jgi:uncharacterized membrane protein YbhN (UPF0104 family)